MRVPWRSENWEGNICENPKLNDSCNKLKNIAINKDDKFEESHSSLSIEDLDQKDWPACVSERGMFMVPFEYTRMIKHPYANSSRDSHGNLTHGHFKKTPFYNSPYSAPAIPFRWMLKNKFKDYKFQDQFGLRLDENIEPKLSFYSPWIQAKENQLELLNSFFNHIKEEESLCFFYTKNVPFIDEPGRFIIGVGRVKKIFDQVEYEYSKDGLIKGMIWDRAIKHTIRPDFEDGFILPYHEAIKFAEEFPEKNFGPQDIVVFAPEDRNLEFSFVSEHVYNDSAIDVLISCKESLIKTMNFLPGSWDKCIDWIDARLGELWVIRGPCPGLGAVLGAFGVKLSNFIAKAISDKVGDNEDPWSYVEKVFEKPKKYLPDLAHYIGNPQRRKWARLPEERVKLLKLLSRFDINQDQAEKLYDPRKRNNNYYNCSDAEILENPYLIYEITRHSPEPVNFKTVDHGIFPDPVIREKHPLPIQSNINYEGDERRVRALIIKILEDATNNGHTLLPQEEVLDKIEAMNLYPPCELDYDDLIIAEEFFDEFILKVEIEGGDPAYKLGYLDEMKQIISDAVTNRVGGKKNFIDADWEHLLDLELGYVENAKNIKLERKAREEKIAALKILAESRISALVGGAGTGKTTLLSVFCNQEDIKSGGVLLLAPTGKARVKLEEKIGKKGFTIAQFLYKNKRFDGRSQRYKLSDNEAEFKGRNIIIDEASMLTEEMLAAVLQSLKEYDRLILVGDSNQLPPIGSGRPFVDIINEILPENFSRKFPIFAPNYAELTINRRQEELEERLDVKLAKWFTNNQLEPWEDDVIDSLFSSGSHDNIRFLSWNTPEEFQDLLLKVIVEDIESVKEIGDSYGFSTSVGAINNGRKFGKGASAKAEDWQILTPVRNLVHGVSEINRLVHKTFREKLINNSYKSKFKPVGAEEIVYGDKVINIANHRRDSFPKDGLGYVANGEIGIVLTNIKYLNVEFSTQPHYTYGFSNREFGDDSDTLLELAYALTVHKAQGSEFGKVILVIPEKCRVISRELIYTAISRHQDHLTILIQGEPSSIMEYSYKNWSEIGKRYTNLFKDPKFIEKEDIYRENDLKSRTSQSKRVRSKSEVIIANLLEAKGIPYSYEKRLTIDGSYRLPDFTIYDEKSGITYYWEHSGMMNDPSYVKNWERRKRWYEKNDILPYEEGGGDKGTLIFTTDNDIEGIDSDKIMQLIEKIFG